MEENVVVNTSKEIALSIQAVWFLPRMSRRTRGK